LKRSKRKRQSGGSSSDHRVHRYARDVVSGAIVAGPYVRAACQRHLSDLDAGHYHFDAGAADIAINFFEQVLRLPDTVGEDGDPLPFALTPANAFIVGSLYGWKRADGYRRFREAYIEMGKGNAKTPLLAGIGLFGLCMDGERAPQIYSAATGLEQAKILWNDADGMVECSELSSRIVRSHNNLAHPASMGFFRPISKEKRSKSGPRPHYGLIDEVHEHPDAVVINRLRAGAKRRKQPLFVEITNSGFDRTSICWQHHEHSVRVLEGTIEDDQWFAYVCALDEGDNPLEDEACWPKANPNLGYVIQPEYLRRQVQNAANIPSETNDVLRLNFCVWTQSHTRFFDMAKWHACAAVSVPDDALDGVPGFGGLDLGQSDDFSAFVGVWPLEDGTIAVRCRFWLPEAALEKYPHRPYEQWQRAGLLTVTEGEVSDFDAIEDAVAELGDEWGLKEIGYDKRFAQQMAQHLVGRGLTMVDTPQGFFLNESLKRTNELVTKQQIAHGGNAILGWMAANAVVRHGRQKEIRLDKDAAKEKIDGIAALAMAMSRFIVQPAGTESIYETRGLATIGG
jgi:phage terminase large subunit-like protein